MTSPTLSGTSGTSSPTTGATSSSSSAGSDLTRRSGRSELATSEGKTSIADSVVQKIAGVAAREVNGVYELGGGAGTARAVSAIRQRIPGGQQSVGQGVSVEVGEVQAAVDIDVVVEYGVSIADLAQAIRRNVIASVEGMTGLEVTEVNVTINDVHLPTDDTDDQQDSAPRVQ